MNLQMMLAQGAAGAAPFDPSDYGTPIYWIIADDVSGSDSDPVATWPFRDYGTDAVQATGGKQPIIKRNIVNGHSVVRFDGVDQDMEISTPISISSFTAFIVQKTTGDCGILSAGDASFYQFMRIGRSGSDVLSFYDGAEVVSDVLSVARSSFSLIESKREIGPDQLTFYENGTSKGSGAAAATIQVKWIGSLEDAVIFTNGDIAEILIFSNTLGDSDREAVEDYLINKYAL